MLSTATPAINAWLNPGHRAIMEVYTLLRYLESRISVVMACIMTEALEVQGIHMPVRVSIPLNLSYVFKLRTLSFYIPYENYTL